MKTRFYLCVRVALATLAVTVLDSPAARAENQEKPATRDIIARVVDRTAFGFVDGKASVNMVLQDRAGKRTGRAIRAQSMKEGDKRRQMIRFQSPNDVRGTSLLLRESSSEEDDIYLYLPAFKRTRRISGADKKNAFVNSDFTYADMEHRDIKHASYERLSDVEVDGADCFHIISTPKHKDSYGKLELFIRKTDYLAQRIKYFDHKGTLIKAYRLHAVKQFSGTPVATKVQMFTVATGHNTFFLVESVNTDTKLMPIEFRPEALAQR
jgi:uncharacterized protein